MEDTELNNQ